MSLEQTSLLPLVTKGAGVTLPPLRDMPRHPILAKLVKEVDRYIAASGIRGNCIKCWNGEFKESHYTQGCCQGCGHLTPTGCNAKPVACALWLCYATWSEKQNAAALMGLPDSVTEPLKKAQRMLRDIGVPIGGIREGAWRDEENWKPTTLQFQQVLAVILFIKSETRKYGNHSGTHLFRIL